LGQQQQLCAKVKRTHNRRIYCVTRPILEGSKMKRKQSIEISILPAIKHCQSVQSPFINESRFAVAILANGQTTPSS
jgi:hypothetical protein